jgi:hypothetical protein
MKQVPQRFLAGTRGDDVLIKPLKHRLNRQQFVGAIIDEQDVDAIFGGEAGSVFEMPLRERETASLVAPAGIDDWVRGSWNYEG